jgi:hypothetical protein
MINSIGFRRKWLWPNFKLLSLHSPGGTKEIHEGTQGSWSPGQDLNPGSPEYEAGVLTARSRRSVFQM